jgi:hypothetical protein
MIEIKSINPFSAGFIVHYTISSACGCSFTRDSMMINQKTEPTKDQALKAIQNELRNKR